MLIGDLAASNRAVATIRVSVNWAPLPPGVYWLEQQFAGSAGFSGPWVPPVTENEVYETGDAIQRQGVTWGAINNAVTPLFAGAAIPFRIFGDAVGQVRASAGIYGVGKLGTNGVGAWDLGAPARRPVLGRAYMLRLINGVAGATPIVKVGTPLRAGLPFPPVGTLYVLPVVAAIPMPTFDALNTSAMRMNVPNGASLCGLAVGWQGFWDDPGAAGFPLGHSNGLVLTLGN